MDRAARSGLAGADALPACRDYDDEEANLRSHMRQERKRRRKQRKSAFETFDLTNVNEEITEFLANSADSSSSLELPDFSKMQRMQVSPIPSSPRGQYPSGLMRASAVCPICPAEPGLRANAIHAPLPVLTINPEQPRNGHRQYYPSPTEIKQRPQWWPLKLSHSPRRHGL